jgi:hypothetical protein
MKQGPARRSPPFPHYIDPPIKYFTGWIDLLLQINRSDKINRKGLFGAAIAAAKKSRPPAADFFAHFFKA